MLYIAGKQYCLSSKALELFISGCSGEDGVRCKNCHNPELWDFHVGKPLTEGLLSKILSHIKEFEDFIDNIFIFGGEPLDNDITELSNLLNSLCTSGKTIWLFTRFDLDLVPDIIKKKCDFIKCGKYDENLAGEYIEYGVKLSSANQHIFKLNKDY